MECNIHHTSPTLQKQHSVSHHANFHQPMRSQMKPFANLFSLSSSTDTAHLVRVEIVIVVTTTPASLIPTAWVSIFICCTIVRVRACTFRLRTTIGLFPRPTRVLMTANRMRQHFVVVATPIVQTFVLDLQQEAAIAFILFLDPGASPQDQVIPTSACMCANFGTLARILNTLI